MSAPELFGVALTAERRRQATVGLLALAAAAFLLALVPTLMALESTPAFLVASVVLLALSIGGMLALILWGETEAVDDLNAWVEEDAPEEEEAAVDEPPMQELLLRCKSCKEVFPVLDDGARPLRAQCTHCGTVGVIKSVPTRKRG